MRLYERGREVARVEVGFGQAEGLITRPVRDRIARAWAERKATEASTRLGSGIGLHGWVGPWTLEETGGRLSWGCVVLHTPDITALFDRIPEGALVVLF